MANENMKTSSEGYANLRRHEAVRYQYYDDPAHNCTYGVGTLVHKGRCRPDELLKPVSHSDVNAQLARGVAIAESAIRKQVNKRALTQAQFDAVVSFVYNAGGTGGASVLKAANDNNDKGVCEKMGTFIVTVQQLSSKWNRIA